MKRTPTKLLVGNCVIIGLLASASFSQAALADWQNQVTSVGTTPAATVFSLTSGSSPVLTDVGALSGDRSFEFIVNAGLGGASSAFLGSRGGANGNQGLKFEQWQDAGVYGLTLFGIVDLYSTTLATLGVDTHVIFSSDGTTGTDLYVNGALVHTFAGNPLALTGLQGLGGIYDSGPGTYFDLLDGSILGFASYDSALSPAEIQAHYFAVVPEPSTVTLLGLAGAILFGWMIRRRRG
jgi:hypothetical protein